MPMDRHRAWRAPDVTIPRTASWRRLASREPNVAVFVRLGPRGGDDVVHCVMFCSPLVPVGSLDPRDLLQ